MKDLLINDSPLLLINCWVPIKNTFIYINKFEDKELIMQQLLMEKDLNTSKLELYFITKDSEDKETAFVVYSVDLKSLRATFRDDFVKKLQESVSNKPIIDFDVVNTEEDCIEVLDSLKVNNLDKIKPFLNKLKAKDAVESNLDLNSIWGYVAVFTNKENKQINLFRKYQKVSGYKSKKQFAFKQGTLEVIEQKESLFLDFKADAIEIDGKMYVINRYYFHLLFAFQSAYKEYVENALDDLNNLKIIDNFDDFSKRCLSSNNLTKKLVKIIQEDRLKWLKENITKIPSVIEAYNLKVEIVDDKINFTKKSCNISDVMKLIMRCCVSDAVDGTKMFANTTKEVTYS